MTDPAADESKKFAGFSQGGLQVRFGPFSVHTGTRQLLRGGRAVHLAPKAFDLLVYLLEERPRVVSKAEIRARIWPGTFVEDANVSVLVAEIRRVLGDDSKTPVYIRTVHGRGYAFAGEVHSAPPVASAALAPGDEPRCWLTWGTRTCVLRPGANVIGRDPGCHIWIDARGVSRRHATVELRPHEITIEDLGSTNGTFVDARPLSSKRRLAGGEVIGIGPENVTFHMRSEGGTAPTERVHRRR